MIEPDRIGTLRALYRTLREAKLGERDALLALLSLASMLAQRMGVSREAFAATAADLYDKTQALDPSAAPRHSRAMRTRYVGAPSECCGEPLARSRRWDAFYCTRCRAWADLPCGCPPDDRWCPVAGLGPRPERAPVDPRDDTAT